MSRGRTPLAKAEATGQTRKNPQRFRARKEPTTATLGEPSVHLIEDAEKAAWEAFKKELPWLLESDRTLVEVACRLRARMWMDPDMGVQALAQLRMCIAAMGGTPADRSKITAPNADDTDPAEAFFN